MIDNILFVIPARGGSKGIPHKNIKEFCGKPLITYSIDLARNFVEDKHICVSTDDEHISGTVENYGLKIPFVRPGELATDTATTEDVLIHALRFYELKGVCYETIVLLQPTSPLRNEEHIREALSLYNGDIDMVISVNKSFAGGTLCNENAEGYLQLIFNEKGYRRQDMQEMYEYNGAIYIINVSSLKKHGLHQLIKKRKYVMPAEMSVDIDTPLDWIIAETLYKTFYLNNDIK